MARKYEAMLETMKGCKFMETEILHRKKNSDVYLLV